MNVNDDPVEVSHSLVPLWAQILILWFGCLLMSATFAILNSAWTVDPHGWVDQWGYLGQSLDFPKLSQAFPNSPTRDLLPVILPQALAYQLFEPVTANRIHDVIQLTVITASFGTIILRRVGSTISAVTIALLFANPYVLASGGSSYTDGKVSAYFGLALMTLDLSSDRWPKRRFLMLSGFLLGCVLFSAILNISLVPLVIFGYASLKVAQLKPENRITSFAKVCFSIGLGLLTSVLLFQSIYSIYGDGFFFWRNVKKLFDFTIGGSTRAPEFSQWLPSASWLIIPVAIALASILFLTFRWQTLSPLDRFLSSLSPVLFTTLLSINVVIEQWPLQHLYFSQTLPIHYLSFAILLKHSLKGSLIRHVWTQAAIFAGLALVSWTEISVFTFANLHSMLIAHLPDMTILQLSVACVVCLALLLICQLRFLVFSPITAIILLAISIFSTSPAYGCQLCENGFARVARPDFISSVETSFKNTIAIRETLLKIDSSLSGKIWFDENSPAGPLIRQVNATTYLNEANNRVSKNFPFLTEKAQPVGSEGALPNPGDLVIIVGFELTSTLPTALAQLSSIGLLVTERAEFTVPLVASPLSLQVVRLQVDNKP